MEIKALHGDELVVSLSGRLDTLTAADLDKFMKEEEIKEDLVALDFTELEYISSAGLRVLLAIKKMLDADNKKLEIRNINAVIKEVFTVTGFINVLNIK